MLYKNVGWLKSNLKTPFNFYKHLSSQIYRKVHYCVMPNFEGCGLMRNNITHKNNCYHPCKNISCNKKCQGVCLLLFSCLPFWATILIAKLMIDYVSFNLASKRGKLSHSYVFSTYSEAGPYFSPLLIVDQI